MQIMPEITTERLWRTSCEFLAAVRYRAEPTAPAALSQPLKCLQGGFYSQIKLGHYWLCSAAALAPKKPKFGVNCKYSGVCLGHLQCLLKNSSCSCWRPQVGFESCFMPIFSCIGKFAGFSLRCLMKIKLAMVKIAEFLKNSLSSTEMLFAEP